MTSLGHPHLASAYTTDVIAFLGKTATTFKSESIRLPNSPLLLGREEFLFRPRFQFTQFLFVHSRGLTDLGTGFPLNVEPFQGFALAR
jgi:hypothetical protein